MGVGDTHGPEMKSVATPATAAAFAEAPRAAAPTLEALYRDCFDLVWRGLLRLGVSPEHLDDAVQDVFLTAHRRLPGFEGRSTPRSWVYGIAVNVAREHRRRRRAQSRVEPLAHEPRADRRDEPDHVASRNEAAALLDRLLDALDDDRRSVLVMVEYEQMTVPEVAAALGVNVNTVYTRLRAARADFEAALARHHRRSP